MTYAYFQAVVKNKTCFERNLNYALSSATLGMGVSIFYGIITRLDKLNGGYIFLCLVALLFLFLAIAGFYLLPNRYKITSVELKTTLENKQQVIKKFLKEQDAANTCNKQGYASFTLWSRSSKTNYKVYLFFDEVRFAFAVLAYGGFIDLGGSQKVRNEISDKLKMLSMETLPGLPS